MGTLFRVVRINHLSEDNHKMLQSGPILEEKGLVGSKQAVSDSTEEIKSGSPVLPRTSNKPVEASTLILTSPH